MSQLVSTNPSRNYASVGSVEISTPEEVRSKVEAAHLAKYAWADLGVAGRIELLRKVSQVLADVRERFAHTQSEEGGMIITKSRANFDAALRFFNSYLDKGEEYLAPVMTFEDDNEIHTVHYEPYGVAACIVPWNFPLSNWVWQCGQLLVAGNTVVFKHSEETPLCGKIIEEVLTSILPEGVFSEVYGDGAVGAQLLQEDIDIVCFTGSSATGVRIKQAAASRLLPTRMELGGSAPGVIFADADVDAILPAVYGARFTVCGQMCDALKRLIVHESRIDEVTEKLAALVESKRIGDALDEGSEFGPLVAKRQLELLEGQVADAVAKGARVVTGGKRPAGFVGAYYEPTLLRGVTREMRVWQEEVFGPVLPIVPFRTEAEAIELANDTEYGLGAYLFTEDNDLFLRVARRIESGMVSQNSLDYVSIHNPFTGHKMSGGGREHGKFGFEDVTQLKVIVREK